MDPICRQWLDHAQQACCLRVTGLESTHKDEMLAVNVCANHGYVPICTCHVSLTLHIRDLTLTSGCVGEGV